MHVTYFYPLTTSLSRQQLSLFIKSDCRIMILPKPGSSLRFLQLPGLAPRSLPQAHHHLRNRHTGFHKALGDSQGMIMTQMQRMFAETQAMIQAPQPFSKPAEIHVQDANTQALTAASSLTATPVPGIGTQSFHLPGTASRGGAERP